ncbi:MAG: homocysteine S-methyltransferase family protein, partial [Pseudomonadota bacterium]|nr:homocysteine S-methyltransferase family protein [Pseudomonadota bacterium]
MDGGMGQEIRRRSGVGDAPLWSAQVMMNDPALVQKTHEDYIR